MGCQKSRRFFDVNPGPRLPLDALVSMVYFVDVLSSKLLNAPYIKGSCGNINASRSEFFQILTNEIDVSRMPYIGGFIPSPRRRIMSSIRNG